ncbi:nitrogen fixation protein NifQ [Novosphingobium mangrovi (ex Huang et al. 2023)]|uniref:Nitrogen fixation protein NifQ n=1 Tax=Novosphingobium mangrovi (ex Huang et al. 2023) TaxID=2976432 RepID=A0ABT2I667_9SPHN|nr:nitrogen fixation protein NifQ [Novosphingobium mangrovi (ex Huang et al. 2023)]MCT2400310.1 nitrogen fixation protein NifQ [Novosphingobium mangrovi (ex Huang et al. 2023)]
MGRAESFYAELLWQGGSARVPAFDVHIASCILALSMFEAECEGTSLADATGLDGEELNELCRIVFPRADLPEAGEPQVGKEEQALRDILWMNCAEASVFELLLVRLIARRSLRPNHLWQDLGLANRTELSMLMEQHFPRLAMKNSADMKWKKFFYRMMCTSEGFRLCSAPVCTECDDFEACFGAEDGEALLARIANGKTTGGQELHQ